MFLSQVHQTLTLFPNFRCPLIFQVHRVYLWPHQSFINQLLLLDSLKVVAVSKVLLLPKLLTSQPGFYLLPPS
jgi:hypothetical protein